MIVAAVPIRYMIVSSTLSMLAVLTSRETGSPSKVIAADSCQMARFKIIVALEGVFLIQLVLYMTRIVITPS